MIEIEPEELFGGKPRPLRVHQLAIPAGRGIRELTAVRGGFIVLVGNASAEPSKSFPQSEAPGPDTRFELLFWNGRDGRPDLLGGLPGNGGKPEGLLVLAETADHIDLLVISDGLKGGAPMSLRVHR